MNLNQSVLKEVSGARFRCLGKKYGLRMIAAAGLMSASWMAAQSLPTDVNQSCTVTPAQFAGWFVSGTVTLNGVVNPANSVTFVPNSNCSFYQWSEQMFLWLNSPAPSEYGGGGLIFNSPSFYDVSPLNASNQRTLIPHTAGIIRPFPLPIRVQQVGPDGLQVLIDKAGRLLEVQPAKVAPSGKQEILNSAGQEVEVDHVKIENGKATFIDTAGKTILGVKPILDARLLRSHVLEQFTARAAEAKVALPSATPQFLIAQRFTFNGHPIIIDPSGNLDPVEDGQADDSVLETQNNSLVYYTIAVNDVYAYFLTGIKTGGIPSSPGTLTFPTTQAELTGIVNFALTKGVTFPDPNALAIEVKASWVDATTLPSANGYLTIQATVPNYTPNASNTTWTPTGTTRTATLAMVGMHVVGSVQGHPELIWATFEHAGNTPLGTYTYNSSSGVKTVSQSTTGSWVFSANGAAAPFNLAHMTLSGANIQAVAANPPAPAPPFTVSPSNTLRWKPFGAATDLIPLNQTVGSATDANTDVISLNNNIRGMLISGDLRANYIFSGATWTFGGAAPTFDTAAPPANNSNQVGTSFLTNSTMETYEQGNNTTSVGATNCFLCHNGSGNSNPLSPNVDDGLSHIYSVLQPLP